MKKWKTKRKTGPWSLSPMSPPTVDHIPTTNPNGERSRPLLRPPCLQLNKIRGQKCLVKPWLLGQSVNYIIAYFKVLNLYSKHLLSIKPHRGTSQMLIIGNLLWVSLFWFVCPCSSPWCVLWLVCHVMLCCYFGCCYAYTWKFWCN